jgi:hypothetical protein
MSEIHTLYFMFISKQIIYNFNKTLNCCYTIILLKTIEHSHYVIIFQTTLENTDHILQILKSLGHRPVPNLPKSKVRILLRSDIFAQILIFADLFYS